MISIGLLPWSSALIWLGLLLFRGQFWKPDQQLLGIEAADFQIGPQKTDPQNSETPRICAVVPARNEAELLPMTLRSLLTQDYPGEFQVVLVDDHSTDGTATVAQQVAIETGQQSQLQILSAEPLPAGWSGKLWAMNQGIQKAQAFAPDYVLLTDADIEHDRQNLSQLVAKAQQESLDLVSLMVRLRCESFWEQLLIPAFVFFFQKLYPFRWVNTPTNPTAAAAGGCILIRQTALDRIGGLQIVRQALIDDCALANAVKSPPLHSIWLGLTQHTRSLRPYPNLETIWDMVARTAFTQLSYSPWLLLGTLIGMVLIYLTPPIALLVGLVLGKGTIVLAGAIGWGLMTLAYFPTVRFYECSPVFALSLPAIGFLYTLMTIDSALRHWQGRGGAWKGRVYSS
ncbi:MAG TPA: glycosyltransferase [Thermosynechococcaceae cyanobacterium]